MPKFNLFLLVLVIGVSLLSCRKTYDPIESTETIDFTNINVPDGFKYEMTFSLDLTVKLPNSLDFSRFKDRVKVYQLSDGGKTQLLISGATNIEGEFNESIKIPKTINWVVVESIVGSFKLAIENKSNNAELVLDLTDYYSGADSLDNLKSTQQYSFVNYNKDLTNNKSTAVVDNLIGNGTFDSDDFEYARIMSSENLDVNGKWYLSTSNYASRDTIQQFIDNGNYVIRTPLVQSGHGRFAAIQKIEVTPGDNMRFSTDIKNYGGDIASLWSWLIIYYLDESGNLVKYYSSPLIKPESDWVNVTVNATVPANTKFCFVRLQGNDYTSYASIAFDNVVVTVMADDTDGDGIADDQDDYPNDEDRAFNNYYPNSETWGTLVYEDLWPGQGDYDFNDIVIDYHINSVTNSENKVVEIFTDYSLRACGASLTNGFGLTLNNEASFINNVSGANLTGNDVNIDPNGTELNQTSSVVFFFDNAFNQIEMLGYSYANTVPDLPFISPDTSQIYIEFNQPQDASVVGEAPYNPFIVVDIPHSRGTEVHLPGLEPTSLYETSLFGQWFDDSNVTEGKFYQSSNNLPWALDLPFTFDYPTEKSDIGSAYLHFVEWAESGGTVYQDWYEDNSGYINHGNVY